jgi:hypothetical protein
MNRIARGPREIKYQECCAIHEAGHAAACLVAGIEIRYLGIIGSPHLRRARWYARTDLEVEQLVTVCLAGPAAEELYCGKITDGGARTDLRMARAFPARHFNPWQVGVELARMRDAAQRLVRTPFAAEKIPLIADALLMRGTLTGDELTMLDLKV